MGNTLDGGPAAAQTCAWASSAGSMSTWSTPSPVCPNGSVPSFGHSTLLRVFVDPDLLQYDEVWAAAGTWNDNFGAAPADTVRVSGGVVTDLKRG